MFRIVSLSSLYEFDKDRTENTHSNSSSVVAYVSVAMNSQLLLSNRLVSGLLAEPFPSNGCLCLRHNSGFQQIRHYLFLNYGCRPFAHKTFSGYKKLRCFDYSVISRSLFQSGGRYYLVT
jgi:hypothetical protein